MMNSYLKDLPRQQVTVGQRGEGIWDLPSPTRFLSSKLKLDALTLSGVLPSHYMFNILTEVV